MLLFDLMSLQIQVFSKEDNHIVKTFSRFQDGVHSGSYRNDGKLLVAGSEEGAIKLFDVVGKALLRVFKGHAR